MRSRLAALVRPLVTVASAASVIFAQAGAVLFLALQAVPGPRRPLLPWLLVWTVALAPVALVEVARGHLSTATMWLAQIVFGSLAGWSLIGSPRAVRRGILVGLCVVAPIMVLTQLGAGSLWNRHATDDATWSLARLWFTGHEMVQHEVDRTWIAPASARRVTFEAGFESAVPPHAFEWLTNGPVEVAALTDPKAGGAELRFGTKGDPYAQRWFDLGEPVGGHAFRVTAQLRSAVPIAAKGCRGIWLQVWGRGGGRSCTAVSLDTSWQTYSVSWTPDKDAASHVIRVVLNDFDGHTVDVRGVRLYEMKRGSWEPIGPLAPVADRISITAGRGAGSVTKSFFLDPESSWHTVHASVQLGEAGGSHDPPRDPVVVSVVPAAGSHLAIRDASVATDAGGATPHTPVFRQGLWFGHPNLAGHSLTAATLASLAISGGVGQTAAILLLGVLVVFLTGSRAAMLALILGSLGLAVFRFRERQRWVIALVAGLAVAATLLVASSLVPNVRQPSWLTFEQGQVTPRTAIWSAGAAAFASHPLTGLAGAGTTFEAYWRSSPYDHTGERLTHAHDFWLEFAARYGLVGVFAALWITGGIVLLAWRQGRWVGLALAGGVLFMNVLDYTLLFTGVLVPLLLGLNTLSAGALPDARDEQPATQ